MSGHYRRGTDLVLALGLVAFLPVMAGCATVADAPLAVDARPAANAPPAVDALFAVDARPAADPARTDLDRCEAIELLLLDREERGLIQEDDEEEVIDVDLVDPATIEPDLPPLDGSVAAAGERPDVQRFGARLDLEAASDRDLFDGLEACHETGVFGDDREEAFDDELEDDELEDDELEDDELEDDELEDDELDLDLDPELDDDVP